MSGTQVSLPLFVALRYLKSSRRDAYITFLSLSAAGGICLGVAALILALAALSGFQTALRQETLARTPHLEIEVTNQESGKELVDQVLLIEGVSAAQLLSRGQIWVVAGGRARPVQVTGFGGTLPSEFPDAPSRQPGLYVSDRLANIWGLAEGEAIELASARPINRLRRLSPGSSELVMACRIWRSGLTLAESESPSRPVRLQLASSV